MILHWFSDARYGPGRIDRTVEVSDIAPTLARFIGIPAPAASEGKVLPLRPPR